MSVAAFLREIPYFALHTLPKEKLKYPTTLFMALPQFILIQTLFSLYVTIPLLAVGAVLIKIFQKISKIKI
jgi:hypothetical protein